MEDSVLGLIFKPVYDWKSIFDGEWMIIFAELPWHAFVSHQLSFFSLLAMMVIGRYEQILLFNAFFM